MADELTPSSQVPTCAPGVAADPPGHKPTLEETMANLTQNMGHMADMTGKMHERLNASAHRALARNGSVEGLLLT